MDAKEKTGAGCLILFCLPFCALGGIGVWIMISRAAAGNWREAVLFCIFALAFGGAGFGLLLMILGGIRTMRECEKLKAIRPNEPWLWREEWASGRIFSSSKSTMLGAMAFAALWNLISFPTLLVIPREIAKKGNYLVLIALIFPIVGVGLAVWAIRSFIHWRKFGNAKLEMLTLPGVVGGRLAGVIHCDAILVPEDDFRVTLRCVNRVTTGSGNDRSTSEHILWEQESILARELLAQERTKTELPVYFQIPFSCIESRAEPSDNCIVWRLQAEARVPGVDFQPIFEVPVFKTPESLETAEDAQDPLEHFRARRSVTQQQKEDGFEILARGPDDVEIEIRDGATTGARLFTFMICIGLVVIAVGLAFADAIKALPIVIGFGFFALIFSWFGFSIWFPPRRIIVGGGRLTVERNILGMASRRDTRLDEIAGVEGRDGNTVNGRQYYDVWLKRRDKGTVQLANSLTSKLRADKLAEAVRKSLGGGPAGSRG